VVAQLAPCDLVMAVMRAFLLVAGLALASSADTATCALNGAEAVDELLDSAVYIMASMARCDKASGSSNDIACAMDVSSAIESVNGMVNVILKAVGNCGALKDDHYKCGLAVGVLTRSFAGMASASAGIAAKCPTGKNPVVETIGGAMESASRYGGDNQKASDAMEKMPKGFGVCVINVKDTVKALFKAIKRIMTIKDNCVDASSLHCAHNTIKVVSSFMALGEYLAGAIGKCDANSHSNAICAQMALRLVRQVENVGRAGVAMTSDCNIGGAERLYLENADEASTPATSNMATIALGALLPLTALVAFVGGSRFAKSRTQVTSDSELLVNDIE